MGDAQGGFAEVAASRRGIGQVLGSVVTAAVALVVGQRRRVVDASAEVAEITSPSGGAVSTIETLSVLMSMTCCGGGGDVRSVRPAKRNGTNVRTGKGTVG